MSSYLPQQLEVHSGDYLAFRFFDHLALRTFRLCTLLAVWSLCLLAGVEAEAITREEVLSIARTYAELEWTGTAANVRRGPDRDGIVVFTPSSGDEVEAAAQGYWVVNKGSIGMPYKWGGFDSPATFANGIRSGRAGGDLYTPLKRKQGGGAVSGEAVGVDCSGFVSRCWSLPKKYDTATLPRLCTALRTPGELRPGDIMNTEGGHVVLFARWVDEAREEAFFFEASPFSKVKQSRHSLADLLAAGFQPWRFRKITD